MTVVLPNLFQYRKYDMLCPMKTWQATKNTVKLLGRTLDDKGTRWLILSASGIEFHAKAKELSFTLTGDCTSQNPRGQDGSLNMNLARYAIYVDGKLTITGSMDCEEKTVSVFSKSEEQTVTVRLLKLSEGTQSYMGIKSINTNDEATLNPTSEKNLKIEFIGDSITCGYGVEGKSAEEPFTTQTENATKAYAYLTAQNLNADYSLVSFSGFGLVSGWTNDGNLNPIQLAGPHYKNFCFSWNSDLFKNYEWDFSQFQPNFVVINYGTNDDSYTRDDLQKQNEYVSCYVDFIKQVRSVNPHAHIVLALGIMTGGNRLLPFMEQAAQKYSSLTGDKNISTYRFTSQTEAEGFGADFHPSEATQKRCAQDFTQYMRSLI